MLPHLHLLHQFIYQLALSFLLINIRPEIYYKLLTPFRLKYYIDKVDHTLIKLFKLKIIMLIKIENLFFYHY